MSSSVSLSVMLDGMGDMMKGWCEDMIMNICEHYKLDMKEVMRVVELSSSVEKVVVVKKVVKVVVKKYPLPFVGVVKKGGCMGIKFNGGLHTQCHEKRKVDSEYCGRCMKQCEKNGNDKPSYGDIRDRLSCDLLEYRDPKGRQTLPFANVLAKKGLSRDEVEKYATSCGVSIPDVHWVVRESKRGRPKKSSVAVSDTDTESVASKPKRRGRPKKSASLGKSVVDDDLLSELEKEKVPVSEGSVKSVVEKKAEKAAKKRRVRPKKNAAVKAAC